jgi:hypothetical protein
MMNDSVLNAQLLAEEKVFLESLVDVQVSLNGPTETGLAAGLDKIRDTECALPVRCTPRTAAVFALHLGITLACQSDELIKDVAMAAYLIVKNKWWDADSNTRQTGLPKMTTENRDRVRKLLEQLNNADATNGVSLLTATKVSYWITNHHVGQGQFQGFIRKVVSAWYRDNIAKDEGSYNLVWALGHWGSTKGILHKLGVKKLKDVPEMANYPLPSADVTMRIQSFPAGTAKAGVCLAVFRRMFHSVFSPIIPTDPGMLSLFDLVDAIREDPAAYHPGAYHFGAHARKADTDVPEETLEHCAAYIHAVGAKSTLANAKVLPSVGACKDNILYTNLCALMQDLAMTPISSKESIEKIRQAGMIGTSIVETIDQLSDHRRAMLGFKPRFMSRNVTDNSADQYDDTNTQ